MIAIGEDKQTIYLTLANATKEYYNKICFDFPIYNFKTQEEELYEFQLTDKIAFVIVEKKGYTKTEILRKEYTIAELGYTEPTTTPEIVLSSNDTEIFDLKDKPTTYWYEITLNGDTTILGYDEEGAKKLIVYPMKQDL